MAGYFWTNTIWYLLLLAISIALVWAAIVKTDNRRFTVAFILANIGLFYLFEFFLVLTDAYSYSPKIFPNDAFLDTYMGNVISQTSIAAACIYLIVFKKKWYWYFLFAAAYYLIEILFVHLGIYHTYWYKTFFTPVILVPLFWLMRRWYAKAAISARKIDSILLQFLGVFAATANTVSFPLRLLNLMVFTGGFFPDPSRDHSTTAVIYFMFFLGMLVSAYRARRWLWKLVVFAGLLGIQYAAYAAELYTVRDGWFICVTLYNMAANWAWICLFGWLVKGRQEPAK